MRIPLFVVLSSVTLAACATQGPGWTHGQPLPDGTGIAVYDCRPLVGDDAGTALIKSHNRFLKSHYKGIRAGDTKRAQLVAQRKAGKVFTPEEVTEFNEMVADIKAKASAETAALGCQFKGLLSPGSVARN